MVALADRADARCAFLVGLVRGPALRPGIGRKRRDENRRCDPETDEHAHQKCDGAATAHVRASFIFTIFRSARAPTSLSSGSAARGSPTTRNGRVGGAGHPF